MKKTWDTSDRESWILGKIIITDIGLHKLKIVNILKAEFNLTPQDALSLSKQGEIVFKEGYFQHLKDEIDQLNQLGATAIFEPNENGLMKLMKNKSYHIEELIEVVKNKLDRDFDKYGKEKYNPGNYYHIYITKDENLTESSVVYVGETIEVDSDDKEIYPNEVIGNNLESCYSCENFQNVIDLAYEQKNTASTSEFIKCLNYYVEKDTFLDLN
jgi:hypothetical protein